MSDDDRQKEMEAIASRIAEHFDSVVVIATRDGGMGTAFHSASRGNSFAVVASAEHFARLRRLDFRRAAEKGDE